jgi:hypothetical protein
MGHCAFEKHAVGRHGDSLGGTAGGIPFFSLLTGQRDAVIASTPLARLANPVVFLAGNTSRKSASANLAYQA